MTTTTTTATPAQPGTLLHINPVELVVDINVREDANLTPEFLANVKQYGVLSPISIYWHPTNNAYMVYMGQRRTLAAVEGKVKTIPALVIDAAVAEATERIAHQYTENEHRAPLKQSEEAGVFVQLSLLGVPAAQIAKRTNTKLARVDDAIKVGKSTSATTALDEFTHLQLTIDDALAFAEFEDDASVIENLTEVLTTRPGGFAHAVQVARDERLADQAKQPIRDEITASGITLIERPSYDDPTTRTVESLYSKDDNRTHLTQKEALAEAGDSLRAYVAVEYQGYNEPKKYSIGYAVANWAEHGWFVYKDSSGPKKGPLDQAEKDARALARVNAKLWVSATTVRQDWIKALLQRRTLPVDYAVIPALWFSSLPNDYGNRITNLAHELLGLVKPAAHPYNALSPLVTTSPGQAPHVLLAIAAASIEAGNDEKKGWATVDPKFPLYLRQLSSWGYSLSELEESLVKKAAIAK
ncbi:ParB N-terminal domain-containing protein [Glaciihabitans sp. dw_435]|uniref:ParB/RepB/Spo0J family partition protein n=1 Tax=Glaciihabitans sp. dw_435 TaxID=2720081 RepID=UPI001BD201F5|nr:ParB N-terminal domain-containing protein [Glaciihabitans sp. dw_435]